MMDEFDCIRLLINNKMEVQYGKLSICDLHNYRNQKSKRRYQVYCSDSACNFAQNYENLDKAITEFMRIRELINARVR